MKAMAMVGVGEGGALCLEDVARKFRQWRESRVRGERIPVTLWGEAVQMCQAHAPQRVAGVLRVGLTGLMRRLERASAGAAARPGHDTEFVEVIMSTTLGGMSDPSASRRELTPTPAHECVLELENAHGAKMRVQLNGQGLASLGALCSSFWGAR
jgi:hypothetical protein